MSIKYTTALDCKVLKNGIIRTCRGRLSYPALFEPTYDETSGKSKFQASLCFPTYVDLSALENAVDEVAKARFGDDYRKKYPKLAVPFFKTADYPKMGIDPEEFPRFIRTSSQAKPGEKIEIVDHEKDPITDQSQVFPGRWALLTVAVYAYPKTEADLKKTGGNRGVSFGLQNVMILEKDTALAAMRAKASDEFEAVSISDSADALFQ